MSGAFGGGDYIRDAFPDNYDDYLAEKEGKSSGDRNKFVSFDNTIGEVTLRLPPELKAHQGELLLDMTDRFYGEAAGDPKVMDSMEKFVSEWLKKKAEEEAL